MKNGNTPKVIEKKVSSWRHTDKHNCPECNKKLGSPYYCSDCNVQLKLKMSF